ncbi:unnamed protein product [Gadus morhua 'NCC']
MKDYLHMQIFHIWLEGSNMPIDNDFSLKHHGKGRGKMWCVRRKKLPYVATENMPLMQSAASSVLNAPLLLLALTHNPFITRSLGPMTSPLLCTP